MATQSIPRKTISISMPLAALRLLDEFVEPQKRSQFIIEAVMEKAEKIKRKKLRETLIEGCKSRYEESLQLAEEFYGAEQETYQRYVEIKENKL